MKKLFLFLLWPLVVVAQPYNAVGPYPLPPGAVQQVINVKNFGAKGDAVTDDTVAIQTAQDSITNTGGIIYFPAGNYIVGTTNPIKLPNTLYNGFYYSITYLGDGNQSMLNGNGNTNSIFLYDAGTNTGTGCWGITFKNLALNKQQAAAASNNMPTIWIYNTNSSPALSDVTPAHFWALDHVQFNGGSWQFMASNVTMVCTHMEDCNFANYVRGGIFAAHMEALTTINCTWSSIKDNMNLATNAFAITISKAGNLANRPDSGLGQTFIGSEFNSKVCWGDSTRNLLIKNADIEFGATGITSDSVGFIVLTNQCFGSLENLMWNTGGDSNIFLIKFQFPAVTPNMISIVDNTADCNQFANKPVLIRIEDMAGGYFDSFQALVPHIVMKSVFNTAVGLQPGQFYNCYYTNNTGRVAKTMLWPSAASPIFYNYGQYPAINAQSGDLTGSSLAIGADWNTNSMTVNTRKYSRIGVPRYDSVTSDQALLAVTDSSAAGNVQACWGGDGAFANPGNKYDFTAHYWVATPTPGTLGQPPIMKLSWSGLACTNGFINQYRYTSSLTGSTTNILGSDSYVAISNNVNCQLPSATTNYGKVITVISLGTTTNAILSAGGTINGGTKWTNTAQYKFSAFLSDGANWFVVDQN